MNSIFENAPCRSIGKLCRYIGVEVMTDNDSKYCREYNKDQASFMYGAGNQYGRFEYPHQIRIVCWAGVAYQLNQLELEDALRFVLRFKMSPSTALRIAEKIGRRV